MCECVYQVDRWEWVVLSCIDFCVWRVLTWRNGKQVLRENLFKQSNMLDFRPITFRVHTVVIANWLYQQSSHEFEVQKQSEQLPPWKCSESISYLSTYIHTPGSKETYYSGWLLLVSCHSSLLLITLHLSSSFRHPLILPRILYPQPSRPSPVCCSTTKPLFFATSTIPSPLLPSPPLSPSHSLSPSPSLPPTHSPPLSPPPSHSFSLPLSPSNAFLSPSLPPLLLSADFTGTLGDPGPTGCRGNRQKWNMPYLSKVGGREGTFEEEGGKERQGNAEEH